MKQAINKLKIWLLEIVFSESFPKLPVLFSEMYKASSDGMENEKDLKTGAGVSKVLLLLAWNYDDLKEMMI